MVNMVNHPKKDIRIISKPGHRCGFQHGGVVQRQVFTLQQRLQTTSRKAEVPGVLWDMCQKLKLNQQKLWFKQHKHGVVTNKRGIETKKTGDSCLLVCWYTVYRGFGLVPPTSSDQLLVRKWVPLYQTTRVHDPRSKFMGQAHLDHVQEISGDISSQMPNKYNYK